MSDYDYEGSPADRLTEFGVPVDAVRALFQEEQAKTMKAAAAIDRANRDPFFAQNAPKIAEYMQSDPQLAQSVARIGAEDPDAAIDYLTMRYKRDAGGGRQGSNADGMREWTQGTKYLLGNPPPDRQAPQPPVAHPVWGNGDAVDQARARYQQTGSRQDAVAYAKARLKSVISDDFLNA